MAFDKFLSAWDVIDSAMLYGSRSEAIVDVFICDLFWENYDIFILFLGSLSIELRDAVNFLLPGSLKFYQIEIDDYGFVVPSVA
jgi:hypothetical protein